MRRVLSGKPFPATPGAPASSKRTDLRASTRTASPAKKPESNVKAKPATKTPKAKKAPVSEQEVESVSVPGGEHEVDKSQVFRIGKEQFYKGLCQTLEFCCSLTEYWTCSIDKSRCIILLDTVFTPAFPFDILRSVLFR